jgi:hypothetical protein
MGGAPYRGHPFVLAQALVPASVVAIYRRRLARSMTGLWAVAGGGILGSVGWQYPGGFEAPSGGSRWPSVVLAAALLATLVGYALTLALAGWWLRHRLRRFSGDAALGAAALAAALELGSVAWPLAGLAMLAPLTLHALVSGATGLAHFSDWIVMSVHWVGHAHLALALMAWRFARIIRRSQTAELPQAGSGWTALLVATGAAVVPGIFLLALPPVLVFVTGAAFVPASFILARRAVALERGRLAPWLDDYQVLPWDSSARPMSL